VERLKHNGKVVELIFKKPINVTINQWIEPEERVHIKMDEKGYRILQDVKKIFFVLGGEYEGHIPEHREVYGCWAILKDDKIDKSWISEVRSVIEGFNYKVETVGFKPEKIEYDGKTLVAYVTVNCCEMVTVKKVNSTYEIIEGQCDELCTVKVTIYDVPEGARVEFIDKYGNIRILSPYVNINGFCGWSTYGRCNSDEDCMRGGCSGQVCQSKFERPIKTMCEWFDCYDADKYGVVCRCVDGKCRWVKAVKNASIGIQN